MPDSLLSLLWMLVSVVLVLVLAWWFTRYVVGRGALGVFGAAKNGGHMEVLAQLGLGREQRLALVRTGERYFLLGISTGNISTLAEFTPEEAALWKRQSEEPGEKQTPMFGETLRAALRQKGRR